MASVNSKRIASVFCLFNCDVWPISPVFEAKWDEVLREWGYIFIMLLNNGPEIENIHKVSPLKEPSFSVLVTEDEWMDSGLWQQQQVETNCGP